MVETPSSGFFPVGVSGRPDRVSGAWPPLAPLGPSARPVDLGSVRSTGLAARNSLWSFRDHVESLREEP